MTSMIAFIGKKDPSPEQIILLEQIGKAIALRGHTLVTTPVGGAAEAVRHGFQATTDRRPRILAHPLRAHPGRRPVDRVIFFSDDQLLVSLYSREPTPIDADWIVLHNTHQLRDFVNATFSALIEDGLGG